MARTQTATTYTTGAGSVAIYIANNKLISDMLKAVFTQTADTGQVVWSGTGVVTALPGNQTTRDYEIYRFNDSLQATAPIFMRIDYWYYSTNANTQHRVTVGTGTDGAGNLTNATPVLTFNAATTSTSSLMGYASSGDGSLMNVMLNLNPAATTNDVSFCAFSIDRFRNADGTPSAEGFNVYIWASTGAVGSTYFVRNFSRNNIATPALVAETQIPCVVPSPTGASTAFSGSTATAFPFYTWGPYVRGASAAVLYGYQGDWPRVSEVSITHYGKTMKFLAIGNAAQLSIIYSTGTNNSGSGFANLFSPLFRWE